MGFFSSGGILPRMKKPMKMGTRVTASRADAPIAKVLVNASGLKSRPDCPVSEKTGRKETVMTSNEKKSDGPTSFAASIMRSHRLFFFPSRSICLWAFSIMMIAASIMAPIAIAIPPKDMMLALIPNGYMTINEIRMPTGIVTMATKADRRCHKKMMQTRATMILSSIIFFLHLKQLLIFL